MVRDTRIQLERLRRRRFLAKSPGPELLKQTELEPELGAPIREFVQTVHQDAIRIHEPRSIEAQALRGHTSCSCSSLSVHGLRLHSRSMTASGVTAAAAAAARPAALSAAAAAAGCCCCCHGKQLQLPLLLSPLQVPAPPMLLLLLLPTLLPLAAAPVPAAAATEAAAVAAAAAAAAATVPLLLLPLLPLLMPQHLTSVHKPGLLRCKGQETTHIPDMLREFPPGAFRAMRAAQLQAASSPSAGIPPPPP